MRILCILSIFAIGASLLTSGCGSSSSAGGGSAQELVPTNVIGSSMVNVGGVAYFMRVDLESGMEPWISDGTPEGTHILKDIVPGPDFRSRETPRFSKFGGLVFFFFDDGTHGRELWRTDGTEAGTELVVDFSPGSTFGRRSVLSASSDKLYMSISSGIAVLELSDAQDGIPVWLPGPRQTTEASLVNIGGMAYHFGNEAEFGDEPWISDGTAKGTRRIIDIYQGPTGSIKSNTDPVFAEFGGSVYFAANDGIVGRELWRTDGTEAGTELFVDLVPGREGSRPAIFRASEERLYLVTDPGEGGSGLWVTELPDGEGAQVVTELTPTNTGITGLANIDGVAYFLLADPVLGAEPWMSDGTPEGTTLLKDIWPGPAGSGASQFVAFGGAVYFFADDGIVGMEVWRTDGTTEGTALYADLVPGPEGFSSPVFGVSEERLFISDSRPETGGQLWVIEASP